MARFSWLWFAAFYVPAFGSVAADELVEPPVCSSIGLSGERHLPNCDVTPSPLKPGRFDVTVTLTAAISKVEVGGYLVETEAYNGAYFPPIIELGPGDTLKVRLTNKLVGDHVGHANATNLHTHGLIVTPRNATDDLPGNGDNIFVAVLPGVSFDYDIPIPEDLPATVLDGEPGTIKHPLGLYWYHAHIHELSARQVAGGMSGLMSIGAPDANLSANAPADIRAQQTVSLKEGTTVSYLMLRDIQVESDIPPEDATGSAQATWAYKRDNSQFCAPQAAEPAPPTVDPPGYCKKSIGENAGAEGKGVWLFTVNGQRFPTITPGPGKNALLRIGNLSANVTYDLQLIPEGGGEPQSFDLVSVDGVVPGTPLRQEQLLTASRQELAAESLTALTLMPASRAEILVKAGEAGLVPGNYVLRTTGRTTSRPGTTVESWPAIALARLALQPPEVAAAEAAALTLARNVPLIVPADAELFQQLDTAAPEEEPPGCAPDIDKSKGQYRKVAFSGTFGNWKTKTDIMRPKASSEAGPRSIVDYEVIPEAAVPRMSFHDFLDEAGKVKWKDVKHTCVRLKSGHHQLWELSNSSEVLHNFHIHQMKFRLATKADFKEYRIRTDNLASLPDISSMQFAPKSSAATWHDTIPVEAQKRLFIVMNFDAKEQVGRYVYHCHVLDHEDAGLMAPMEVLD